MLLFSLTQILKTYQQFTTKFAITSTIKLIFSCRHLRKIKMLLVLFSFQLLTACNMPIELTTIKKKSKN